jgi:16S rRNA (guanine527-N7)-methyltransferase
VTEEEALKWLQQSLHVPRETLDRLGRFVEFLSEEANRQNLIARSTMASVWARHIVDSAQLIHLAGPAPRTWIDLGSGAGFPGLIVAVLTECHVTLVEERRKRVEFLKEAVELLALEQQVSIYAGRAEIAPDLGYDVISARAFAPLDRMFGIAERLANPDTLWLLPKGKNAQPELDAAAVTWQGSFRLEPSVTDPASAILVARNVRPREQR